MYSEAKSFSPPPLPNTARDSFLFAFHFNFECGFQFDRQQNPKIIENFPSVAEEKKNKKNRLYCFPSSKRKSK